jgi:hypothetical protein
MNAGTSISKGTASAAAGQSVFEKGRLAREWATMRAMVTCYCNDLHHTKGTSLCSECEEFLGYANVRLQRCRFGEEKPTCAKCPVHCYAAHRREQVRTIMIYAGPRMLFRHPLMSLFHWIDSFRRAPAKY